MDTLPLSTGLVIPDDITEAQWEAFGRKLGKLETAYHWTVGDWWIFGETKKYGKRLEIVSDSAWTGPSYEVCKNDGWVCRAFEKSFRNDLLTFTHYRVLVPLKIAYPELVNELLEWCVEPIQNGKKPRSVIKLKVEIKKRLNTHFEPLKRANPNTKDFPYVDFISRVEDLAKLKDFNIPEIAKTQLELFGSEQILAADLAACEKVIAMVSEFVAEVRAQGGNNLREVLALNVFHSGQLVQ
jgi:hypothetical protein